jgi:hypothetical protein
MEKRNIIAGLLLLSVAILLGPYMMRGLHQEQEQVAAQTELREAFAELKSAQESVGEPAAGAAPSGKALAAFASASRRATRAHVNYGFAQDRRGNLTMTHAHGILQGMLNILAGLFLGSLAVGRVVRLGISWGLIAGSWLMVGSLLIGNLWWQPALKGILWGGTVLILALYALTLAVMARGFHTLAD